MTVSSRYSPALDRVAVEAQELVPKTVQATRRGKAYLKNFIW